MISIIIPAYNQHDMTKECILAVMNHTPDCEIIIIDNGSNPPFPAPWSTRTTIIRNLKNLGFPAAVNQGIRAAAGDTIILLNNDVIVTPGWADRLVGHLLSGEVDECPTCDAMLDVKQICTECHPDEEDSDLYSIVAPMTNYCAGLQRVILPAYRDGQELDAEAQKWAQNNAGQSVPANWVIGFCMAFRRSLYDELGEFDESLWPCSGEEIDFCLRARQAGYNIGIARDVYVHHFGSQTFGDMARAGQLNYNDIVVRNNNHLAQKWGESWIKQAA